MLKKAKGLQLSGPDNLPSTWQKSALCNWSKRWDLERGALLSTARAMLPVLRAGAQSLLQYAKESRHQTQQQVCAQRDQHALLVVAY